MEVAPQIDFQGTDPSPAVRDDILRHIKGLEDKFGRITSCRVVVKAPGHHHREGAPFEINIWLSLPDRKDVAVTRTRGEDERPADISFAINDAFKRAGRRLQDQVRLMRHQVKTHGEAPEGQVTELSADETFGFLTTADGRQVYFHRNAVLNDHFNDLRIGSKVAFVEEQGEKGAQATTVRMLAPHRLHDPKET
jgi:cold shock CspA family protein